MSEVQRLLLEIKKELGKMTDDEKQEVLMHLLETKKGAA